MRPLVVASIVCGLAAPLAAQGAHEGRWHAQLAGHFVASKHDVEEGGKGTGTRVALGRGAGLSAALGFDATRRLRLLAEVGWTRHPSFTLEFCLVGGFLQCDYFPLDDDGLHVFNFGLGAQLSLPARGFEPFLEAGFGGSARRYDSFVEPATDVRGTWYGGAGVRLPLGERHRLTLGLRGTSVVNPPWGHEAFGDLQARVGLDFGL